MFAEYDTNVAKSFSTLAHNTRRSSGDPPVAVGDDDGADSTPLCRLPLPPLESLRDSASHSSGDTSHLDNS